MVGDERISPDDTADKLGLEDEDVVDVAMEALHLASPGEKPREVLEEEVERYRPRWEPAAVLNNPLGSLVSHLCPPPS